MLDYNYHNWSSFVVKDITEIPTSEHYVVLESKARSYRPYTGYEFDRDTEDVVYQEIRYFAFLEESKWKELIAEIYSIKPGAKSLGSESKFAFFKQAGRVIPKISVSVSL